MNCRETGLFRWIINSYQWTAEKQFIILFIELNCDNCVIISVSVLTSLVAFRITSNIKKIINKTIKYCVKTDVLLSYGGKLLKKLF